MSEMLDDIVGGLLFASDAGAAAPPGASSCQHSCTSLGVPEEPGDVAAASCSSPPVRALQACHTADAPEAAAVPAVVGVAELALALATPAGCTAPADEDEQEAVQATPAHVAEPQTPTQALQASPAEGQHGEQQHDV